MSKISGTKFEYEVGYCLKNKIMDRFPDIEPWRIKVIVETAMEKTEDEIDCYLENDDEAKEKFREEVKKEKEEGSQEDEMLDNMWHVESDMF